MSKSAYWLRHSSPHAQKTLNKQIRNLLRSQDDAKFYDDAGVLPMTPTQVYNLMAGTGGWTTSTRRFYEDPRVELQIPLAADCLFAADCGLLEYEREMNAYIEDRYAHEEDDGEYPDPDEYRYDEWSRWGEDQLKPMLAWVPSSAVPDSWMYQDLNRWWAHSEAYVYIDRAADAWVVHTETGREIGGETFTFPYYEHSLEQMQATAMALLRLHEADAEYVLQDVPF